MPLIVMLLLFSGVASAVEMLDNADFANGLQGWRYHHHEDHRDVEAEIGREAGQPQLSFQTRVAARAPYMMLSQMVDVVEGKTYRYSVEARIQGEGRAFLAVKQLERPFASNGCHMPLAADESWQRFEVTFKASGIETAKPPHALIMMGEVRGRVSVRNASLVPVEAEVTSPRGHLKIVPLQEAAAASSSKRVDTKAMVADFAKSVSVARKTYGTDPIALGGHVTALSRGTGGNSVLELDGGAIKVQAKVSDEDLAYLKEELAAAKTRIRDFANSARKQRLSTRERKAREVVAYPSVDCVGVIAGYRGGAVLIRDGSELSFSQGQTPK